MQQQDWAGVFPAITTPFLDDLTIDHRRLAKHVAWLVDQGCRGIVALGSLGEASTLTADEKISILETCKRALGDRAPLVAGIAGLSTADCVSLAKRAAAAGCDGLMVLPPYVYKGDWRESKAHFEAVLRATPLSCMLYNNPIAYGTDVTPTQVRELSRNVNLHAVKESSGDVRRVTAIREVNGDRLMVFAGMDDMILESIPMGASGWIAGLVNALPAESVALFELGRDGRFDEARAIYEWFLPLLEARHRHEVRAADQAGADRGGAGQRRRASSATRARGCRARGSAGADPRAACVSAESRYGRCERLTRRAADGCRFELLRAHLSRGAQGAARPCDDIRRDRTDGRPSTTGETRRLRAERAAQWLVPSVASNHQCPGPAQSRTRGACVWVDAAHSPRA